MGNTVLAQVRLCNLFLEFSRQSSISQTWANSLFSRFWRSAAASAITLIRDLPWSFREAVMEMHKPNSVGGFMKLEKKIEIYVVFLHSILCLSLWANQENIKSIYFMLIMIGQEYNLITVSSLVLPKDQRINNQNLIALGQLWFTHVEKLFNPPCRSKQ